MAKKEEISCCGIPCGHCIRGDSSISEKLGYIMESIKKSRMDEWYKDLPGSKDIDFENFKKSLVWLEKSTHCLGCHAGGGSPVCLIRNCCKEKGVEHCGKCKEFPCDKTKKFKNETGIDVHTNLKNANSLK